MPNYQTWQARIEALPDSEFPYAYNNQNLSQVATREEVLAAFTWLSDAAHDPLSSKAKLQANPNEPNFKFAVNRTVGWYSAHMSDVAQTTEARKRRLAPLQAARERRAQEKATERVEKQKRMWALLREDAKALAKLVADTLKNEEAVDGHALDRVAGKYGSMCTRLRYQAAKVLRKEIEDRL